MPKLTEISRALFEKFLISEGCRKVRTKGDHIIYDRKGLKRPIIIQADRTIPKFIIKSNLRTLGVSTKDYLNKITKIR